MDVEISPSLLFLCWISPFYYFLFLLIPAPGVLCHIALAFILLLPRLTMDMGMVIKNNFTQNQYKIFIFYFFLFYYFFIFSFLKLQLQLLLNSTALFFSPVHVATYSFCPSNDRPTLFFHVPVIGLPPLSVGLMSMLWRCDAKSNSHILFSFF